MTRYAWLPLLLSACDGGNLDSRTGDTDEFVDETDTTPPVIEHEEITEALPFGQDISVQATVTDEGGVMFVNVWYKNESAGDGDWDKKSMSNAGAGDVYTGTIPGDEQSSAGMHYYIEATDQAQNVADDPERGADDPYHIRLY